MTRHDSSQATGFGVPDPPKPNTQAISWFYGEFKKEALQLDPKYQRNPIWSIGQKCFLIDSIISGCPLPQVFLNIKIEGAGLSRKTMYEVVDGQQRLRAVLEFLSDDWPLISTTAKSYPVSEAYKPQIGKKYSELPPALQELIWNYPLAVQELRGWTDLQIRALFRRLNYVVEKLNAQELRHSQYFGEFVNVVEKLADEPFWDEIALFTRRDSQRMKDIEFISELFVVVIDGIQDQQKTLDRFYADYDVVFPKKHSHVSKFRQTLESLRTIEDVVKNTRFLKKADFYALFAATVKLNRDQDATRNLSHSAAKLKQLSDQLEQPPATLGGEAARYYTTVIEGPNKLAKRLERTQILEGLLEP
ncbi:MAG: DUF262 domain-containing protein [Verrucomicrobia bacterium]|nr:DUF262 domain-containing protein [Verrucomicrobiota bacterium]